MRTPCRSLCLVAAFLVAAACGGSKPPVDDPDDDTLPDPVAPGDGDGADDGAPLTELQRRQHAACERVIPRLTACAVEDARRNMTPEEYAKNQIDETAPYHTRKFLEECKAATMSSRQVRVYEVCDREETECGPLVACLEHAAPGADDAPAP